LQDVHWSHGSFGYFPTYSLGSVYAAQFYDSMKKQIRGVENHIAKGNLEPVLNWLRDHIHSKGRLFTSEELCKRTTGQGLKTDFFIRYAEKKYKIVYP
jgi:carboxypeptidase Taq